MAPFGSRTGSLLAILPLGAWTTLHLWNNLAAFRGAEPWQSAVTGQTHPLALVVTMVIVLGPLLIHAVWGIGRLLIAKPNNVRYGFYANLKYALQRASAVGLLLFLGAHLWLALIKPRMTEGHAEPFAEIAHEMRFHTPTIAVYVLGVLAIAFHLANGVQTFCMGWGAVASRRALQRLEIFVLAFFAALLAMGWGSIWALYQAGR
jgi:succinate dehydrogenase / fumarate reductase cytochrome b subunit